jgi:hypothetical protein
MRSPLPIETPGRAVPTRPRPAATAAACLIAAGLALSFAPALKADDQIRAKIAAAGDAERWKADIVAILEETDTTIMPNGLGVATHYRLLKILRDGGIRSQSVQRFPFDPHTNRVDLLSIRVYRADGKVEEIPVENPVRQPQPAWGIFWPTEQYLIQLPRLEIGDAVETRWRLTGFNVAYLRQPDNPGQAGSFDDRNAYGVPLKPPVPGHWHDEVHFWSSYPIIEKRYIVRVPRDKTLQYEVYNGELRVCHILEGDTLVYTFEKQNIEPFKEEPAMEALPNVAPKLLLATLPTWEDKSRWLYEVSEPQFEADDAIRAKVAEIIRDCRTDEEKYTALCHWVAENIRYAGTSRGMCEGYTVHRSIETFADRCGVCKDKAGMLVTMLRVAGFESYLVMTMARQRVDRIPADQFNHAVTCIRYPDGTLKLLDPTWMPKSRDVWSTLEPLQHVVYGLPEGKGLSLSPYFPPEECQATWVSRSVLRPDNALEGTLEFTAVGAPENRLRRALATFHPDDRQQLFDASFQRLSPAARVSDVVCMDPVDFSGPIRLSCRFEAPDFVLGHGPRRYIRLPMMQTVLGDRVLVDMLGQASLEKRTYGLKLWATRLARFEETILLPKDWNVVATPQPVQLDGPSAALSFQVESKPGEFRYVCELRVKKWTIPPQEYHNFKQVMDKFDELTGPVLAVEVEDADVPG